MSTEQDIRPDERVVPPEAGDHDRMSHYAPKDQITQAMVYGTPVKALCGKQWVPTRDGLKFPVCPICKEKYEALEK